MKKLILLTTALLASLALSAQNKENTVATFNIDNDEQITLSGNDNSGGVTLGVAGYNINLSKPKINSVTPQSKAEVNTRKRYFTMGDHLKLGWANLTPVSYTGYSAEQSDFLDINGGRSCNLQIGLAGLHLGLDRNNVVTFKTGIDIRCSYYVLNPTTSFNYTEGKIQPLALAAGTKKSKFCVSYAQLPISFLIKPNDDITIGLEGYAGVLLNNYTKSKRPKVKTYGIQGFNPYIYGTSVSLSYKRIGIYCDYSFSELFAPGKGPSTNMFSMGFIIR